MSLSRLALTATPFALLALAACGGEKTFCEENPDDAQCQPDPCEEDPTLPECQPVIEYFEPSAILVSGLFGYDSATQTARHYLLPTGAAVNPTMELLIVADDYDPAFEDTFCAIVFEFDTAVNGGMNAGSWVAAADADNSQNVMFGITFPATSEVLTNCTDLDFDPELWTEDPVAHITSQVWGLGLSSLDSDVETALETEVVRQLGQEAWDEDWAPYLIGGGLHWNTATPYGVPGGFFNFNFANGYAVTETFVLDWVDQNGNQTYDPPSQSAAGDDLVPILASDATDGSLPSGAYSIQAALGLLSDCVADINLCLSEG